MKQIKLLKDWKTKKKGDIINISEKGANSAVQAGAAEYLNKSEKVKLPRVVVDKTNLENILKKYPSISEKQLLKWIEERCEFYSNITPDARIKFGFEKGIKKEFNDQIKDFIFLIDQDYKIDYDYLNKKLIEKTINNYLNKEDLAKKLWEIQAYFYDSSKIWWLWDFKKYKWKIVDETDILNMVSNLSNANTVKAKEKSEIIESMKQFGRKNKPKKIKPTWIQFKNKIYDYKTGEEFEATPEYFVTNPIPHELSKYVNTPVIDRIFEEWVGKDYVQTLYEIIAYCLLPDYPLHRIFCFIGSGMNGKSKFLELIRRFIGEENVTTTELDTLIHSRFEITRLHKKLVCQMGETNFDELSKTSIIKKLTGQDTIGFEYKNKELFEDYNYAKILIATNNLPTTTDKTKGFYRRWLIIDFPNEFSEQKDILAEIPEEEYSYLATKCVYLLKDLLEKRSFYNEGDIEMKKKRYEEKSDFLQSFLDEYVEEKFEGYITKADFKRKFDSWCKERGYRYVSDVVLGKKMKEKEYSWVKKSFSWLNDGRGGQLAVWDGIEWKQ